MPETITGPGIGAGPSEIAAVSVGVYVVDNTGAGFARVKAKIEAQASELGDQAGVSMGTAINRRVEDVVGGDSGSGPTGSGGLIGGVARRIRSLHRIVFGLIAGPMLIEQAFKLGTAIGQAIWGKIGDDGLRTMEEVNKIIESSREKLTEKGSRLRPDAPPIDPGLKSARDRLAISREEKRVLETQIDNLQRYARSNKQIAEDEHEDATERGLAAKELREELEDIEGKKFELVGVNERLAETEREIQQIVKRIKDDEERITEEKKDQIQREKILKMESQVLAEHSSADIGRIRQLLEASARQRFPNLPGSSVIYGNQGIVR